MRESLTTSLPEQKTRVWCLTCCALRAPPNNFFYRKPLSYLPTFYSEDPLSFWCKVGYCETRFFPLQPNFPIPSHAHQASAGATHSHRPMLPASARDASSTSRQLPFLHSAKNDTTVPWWATRTVISDGYVCSHLPFQSTCERETFSTWEKSIQALFPTQHNQGMMEPDLSQAYLTPEPWLLTPSPVLPDTAHVYKSSIT